MNLNDLKRELRNVIIFVLVWCLSGYFGAMYLNKKYNSKLTNSAVIFCTCVGGITGVCAGIDYMGDSNRVWNKWLKEPAFD